MAETTAMLLNFADTHTDFSKTRPPCLDSYVGAKFYLRKPDPKWPILAMLTLFKTTTKP